ncbi:hypothetical protein AEA42_00780 [Shewanella sp. Sh95]|nr:hypothetical protein AEA42_00780 [Shewanella sp. Sh95]
MSFLINMGKAITLIAWLMMAYNLVMPFAGNIGIILNILLGITCLMHCSEESPDDLQINHQIRVEAHLVA